MKVSFNYEGNIYYFFITNPKDRIQSCWVKRRFYEEELLNYVAENYSGGIAIDVGACFGNHTLFFANIFDKVISFEPNKELFNILKKIFC